MATKNDGETNGCTFLWKIENVRRSFSRVREFLSSPVFIAEALQDTKWMLRLYTMGYTSEKNIECYLYRPGGRSEPDNFAVNYQIAILDKDGSFLSETIKSKSVVPRLGISNLLNCAERNKVFVTEREAFLPEDTLTLQCTIWKGEETPIKTKHISARTVFKINKRSVVWRIDGFSTLKPGLRNKFKDDILDFDLVLNEALDFVKILDIDIISFSDKLKYFSFMICIENVEGDKEACGKHEYFSGDLKKGILSTPLYSKVLMENKHRYLHNDVLLLNCEYVSSNGTIFEELLYCGQIYPKGTKVVVDKEALQQMSALVNDYKSLYNDGIYSDIELRTLTKTFPSHRNILSARSPVFRRMFSNDMKENNRGYIEIKDLEDDTIHRMLLYIYTETLEGLQLGNACKLYAAADKYEVLSLRKSCSSFLKDNLCLKEAYEILILSDLHQDVDLKSTVQDYILKHDKEVFGSEEWEHFMDTNPKLAAETMYRKVFPGKGLPMPVV